MQNMYGPKLFAVCGEQPEWITTHDCAEWKNLGTHISTLEVDGHEQQKTKFCMNLSPQKRKLMMLKSMGLTFVSSLGRR